MQTCGEIVCEKAEILFLCSKIKENARNYEWMNEKPVGCNHFCMLCPVPGDGADLPFLSQSSPRHSRDWMRGGEILSPEMPTWTPPSSVIQHKGKIDNGKWRIFKTISFNFFISFIRCCIVLYIICISFMIVKDSRCWLFLDTY